MDQLTLLDSSEVDIYEQILPELSRVIIKNWADSSLLSFEERQSYHSVMFDGSVVMRIKGGKNPYIEFPSYGQEIPHSERKDNYIRVKLKTINNAVAYQKFAGDSLQKIIDNIPKEFSCCSRYMECSDNLKCLMPDRDMAMRCGYRKSLMNGFVFYGKNRNID